MRKQRILVLFIVLNLIITGNTVNLIPQYQSGYEVYTNACGTCSTTQTVTFSPAFTVVPQVIIGWAQNDLQGALFGLKTEIVSGSISLTQFQYLSTNQNVNGFQIYWYAFVDDNIFTEFGSQTVTSFTITYATAQTSVPSVMIFTNGIVFSTAGSVQNNWVITIGTPTSTTVDITIAPGSGFDINYYSYSLIYADQAYLATGQGSSCGTLDSGTLIGCCSLFTPITNLLAKYTGIGMNSYAQDGTLIKLGVINNGYAYSQSTCSTQLGYITAQISGTDTIVSAYQVAYFQYVSCPYYCTTCMTTFPNCEACKTGSQRTLASNCASCSSQFYLIASTVNCGTCDNICNNCSGTSSTCTACFGNRLIANNCLACPAQFYVKTGQVACDACDNICDNCSGTSSTCTACFGSRLIANNCLACPAQYFIVTGQVACAACDAICDGCSGTSSTCAACFGSRLIADNCLTCPTQFYVKTGQVACDACSNICDNCSGTSSNCTACFGNRLIANNCLACPAQFYVKTGQVACDACDNICDNCSGTSSTCTACFGSRLIANNCLACPSQFYVKTGQVACDACDNICNNCSGTSSTCTACFGNRLIANNCLACPSQQYIVTGQVACAACDAICDGCSGTSSTCAACFGNRLIADNCLTCPSQFYVKTGQVACDACSNICDNCTGTSSTCSACFGNRLIANNCLACPAQFYIKTGQVACDACSNICDNCSGTSTTCTACFGNRLIANNCLACPAQFYVKAGQVACDACDSICDNCSVTSSTCTACFGSRLIANNCLACPSQFYIVTGQVACAACDNICNNCSGTSSTCTACFGNRLIADNCLKCPAQFYVKTAQVACDACSNICDNCSGTSTTCTACFGNRLIADNCLTCPAQFYVKTGQVACDACSNICDNCSGTSSTCTACFGNRLIANNCLACPAQFYVKAGQVACDACDSICDNCSVTSSTCTACFGGRLIANNCLACPSQFYIVTGQVACAACDKICNNCSGTSSTCTACFGNRVIATNCLTCPTQFYLITGQLSCASCMNYCNGCSGTLSTCTACNGGRASPPACNTCSSASMYIQKGVLNCQACASYCTGCVDASSSCLVCLAGSGRSNPPNCTTCSLAQFVQVGVTNCQSCNSNCGSCVTTASQCLACSANSLTLNIPNCKTCPSQMYLQLSNLACSACSIYCDNCKLSATNCTICLASTQRLYPPNCSTCPSNMFLQVGQNNCQQCDPLCNQCTSTHNNCTACNGLYRGYPPSCNQCTQPNYYIDSSTFDCQPCASYCNGCVTSATNCLACWPFNFGQLTSTCPECPINQFILNPPLCSANIASYICTKDYNRDSTCNCFIGYSNSDNQLNCLKCSQTCSTCTITSNNCLKCNSLLQLTKPPACETCIDGWFMFNGSCQQCTDFCTTCIQSRYNCLSCSSPRINPPLCTCPNGYFNDCTQQCSFQCQTCSDSASKCLTCSGNRIFPPLCGCPDGTIQQSIICSNCSTAAPYAQFSNDLSSINIVFEFLLNSINDCSIVITQQSLLALGINSSCSVNQNVLVVSLGKNSSIALQQPIFLNQGQLQFSKCNTTINTIVTPIVRAPLQLIEPILVFDSQAYTATPCDNVLINIIGAKYNGQRRMTLLQWKINKAGNQTLLQPLIQDWNSNSLQASYTIYSKYLKNQQLIELQVYFQNFIGQQSSELIQIYVQSEMLQISLQVPDPIYIFDTAQLNLLPQLVQCEVNQLINQNITVQVVIANETTILHFNYTILSNQQQVITFDPFQLTSTQIYYVSAYATWNKLTAQLQKSFQVQLLPIKPQINGGDQEIGINQMLNLSTQIFDPNIQTLVNVSKYNFQWFCYNLITAQECQQFKYSLLTANLNTTNYQPFTTVQIQIQIKNSNQTSSNNISVSIIERKVSQVWLIGNQYQLNTPMNIQDKVDVTIKYQSQGLFDVDHLTYYAYYLTSAYQINQVQLYYIDTSIVAANFLEYQQSSYFRYKIIVTNPEEQTTTMATQSVSVNIPPQNCRLTISPIGAKFNLQIDSCMTSSQLQYQFVYYYTNDGYIKDSTNGIIIRGLPLNEYQIKPILKTYLFGQNTSIIVGFIKDSYNGISNVTVSLKGLKFIDQTMFNLMFMDEIQNLPNNIYFILLYVQSNNLTLTTTYFNQIQSQFVKLKKTNQIGQLIQQQLASQQNLVSDQISSQLTETGLKISDIKQQLTILQEQSSQGSYNKNYQIQLRQLEAQVHSSANQVSFLYAQSQLKQNRRVLDVSGTNITPLIISEVQNLTDILVQLTKVNENKKTVTTEQFNISAQKFSTEKINQNLGIQVVSSPNQTVTFTNSHFYKNPYQNESDFITSVKAPLMIPNLTNSQTVQIKPAHPIPISFITITNATVQCASQLEGTWRLNICNLVQQETTQCLCDTLSPISLIQAPPYILGQFELFERRTIDQIKVFHYQETAFIYLMVFFILAFSAMICILYRIDAADHNRVYPVNELPKQKPFDQPQKLKIDIKSNPSEPRIVLDSLKNMIHDDHMYTSSSLIGQVLKGILSKIQGFLEFLRNSHVILELFYRYDDEESRVLRLSILQLQIFGQICIFVIFGKDLNAGIVIALSLFETAYGFIFQITLAQMIKSKNSVIRCSGIILSVLITGLCIYLIIASIAVYTSVNQANIACGLYLASFGLDYLVTSILVELGKYFIILKNCDKPSFCKLFQIIIPSNTQPFIFGRKLLNSQIATER